MYVVRYEKLTTIFVWFFLGGFRYEIIGAEFLGEPIDASQRVDELVATAALIEGMAGGADFDLDFGDGCPGLPARSATAFDGAVHVIWMYAFSHDRSTYSMLQRAVCYSVQITGPHRTEPSIIPTPTITSRGGIGWYYTN